MTKLSDSLSVEHYYNWNSCNIVKNGNASGYAILFMGEVMFSNNPHFPLVPSDEDQQLIRNYLLSLNALTQ